MVSCRPWNNSLPGRLNQRLDRYVKHVTNLSELTYEAIAKENPEWIFVAHWNHIIPESIWRKWPTVIFHMTDLPYGRGGSPLQNLILLKQRTTVLSAIRCEAGMDTGDIYLKENLSLDGSAEEIFLRANHIMEHMIEEIIREKPIPTRQSGTPVLFKRRSPDQSNIAHCPEGDIRAWYDHIRMLDAAGYPHAFLEANGMRIELRRVSWRSEGLYADVKIMPLSQEQTKDRDTES